MTGDPYISRQFGTTTLGFNNLLDYELSRLNYLGCLVCKCTYKANMHLNYSFGMKEQNMLNLILIIFWNCLEFLLVSCNGTVSAGACLWLGQGIESGRAVLHEVNALQMNVCWYLQIVTSVPWAQPGGLGSPQPVHLEKCRTFTAERDFSSEI